MVRINTAVSAGQSWHRVLKMPDITSAISTANPRRIHIRRAAIQCVSGPEAGESWLMERDVIRIGSAKTCDIVITDPTVSRRHAEIRREIRR